MKPRPAVFRPLRPGAARSAGAVAAVAILLLAAFSSATPAKAATGSRLQLGLGLSTWYDDNVLQYSSDQIALLDSGTRPERFSVESSDDPAVSPSVSIARIDRLGAGRTRTLRLRGQGEFHSKNGTADFRSLSALWQEPLTGRGRISVSGWYTPHYYLRQLRDDDVTALGANPYRRAEFSLAIGSLRWRQKTGRRTAGEIGYQFERRGYNADFAERTSNTHEAEAAFGWTRVGGRGSATLHGGYRSSAARGSDGDEAPGAAPDDPDISYHGLVAGVDAVIDLQPTKTHGFTMGLGYGLATRDYTSTVASDTYHVGRTDTDHAVDASLRWSARGGLAVRAFYRFEKNTANLGVSAPATSDVGSYTENQVGAAVEWSRVIWRQSAGQATEGDDDRP